MQEKASIKIMMISVVVAFSLTFILKWTDWEHTQTGDAVTGVMLLFCAITIANYQRFERGFSRAIMILFAIIMGLESLGAIAVAIWPSLKQVA